MKAAVFLDRDGTVSEEVGYVNHIDLDTGFAVGARGVLVLSGYGKGEYLYLRSGWPRQPDHVAENLAHAVDWILSRPGEVP